MLNKINISQTASSALYFNDLAKSLCNATESGVISFDPQLNIIDFTPHAAHFLDTTGKVDNAVAGATKQHGWKNWTEIIRSVLNTGHAIRLEAVKITAGEKTHHLDMVFAAAHQAGRPDTIIGGGLIITDVTDKATKEGKPAQTERLATMGKVAGRVAHELNNPLDGILRYVNLSLRALESQPDKTREYLQHCRDGLMRMVRIVGEMLEFSRGVHSPFELEPLDKVAADALAAMAGILEGVEIRLERNYAGPALPVKSEAMYQVFCNLIKNAADAMAGKGALTVCLTPSKNGWQASFQDTGGGFDPTLAEEMFKPFFTTKPHGRGTGLGLAICRDIVEQLNGNITARNIDGGSEFRVWLPGK